MALHRRASKLLKSRGSSPRGKAREQCLGSTGKSNNIAQRVSEPPLLEQRREGVPERPVRKELHAELLHSCPGGCSPAITLVLALQ